MQILYFITLLVSLVALFCICHQWINLPHSTYTPLSVSCQWVCDMTDSFDTTNQLHLSKVTRGCSALIGCCAFTWRPCLLWSMHHGTPYVCVRVCVRVSVLDNCVWLCIDRYTSCPWYVTMWVLVCFQVGNIMWLSWHVMVGVVNSNWDRLLTKVIKSQQSQLKVYVLEAE